MSKEKFLLYMLAGIFAFQSSIFGAGFYMCSQNGGLQTCPDLGERYESTFNVMIATTLALITGASIKES